MKRLSTKVIIAALFCAGSLTVQAQYVWTQKANFPGNPRAFGSCFSIGHYGYVGSGADASTNYHNWYRYDQNTNSWSAIAAYPGAGCLGCTCFSIGGKGYVGLGLTSGVTHIDLWEYDTTTNNWTQKANFPGAARYGADAFVIGTNAYVCTGNPGGPPYLSDCWKYNSITNSWTQIASYPLLNTNIEVFVSIGKYGYAGCGGDGSSVNTAMYKYDTAANTWTAIPSIPYANGLGCPANFALADSIYSVSGRDNSSHYIHESYSYSSVGNSWTSLAAVFPGVPRWDGLGFSIGNIGYVVTGMDSTFAYYNDLWQYSPVNPLGVNEQTVSNSILIYPNPANNRITVTVTGNGKATLAQLFDVTGKKVYEQKCFSNSKSCIINSQSFSNGVYFLKVQMQDGSTLVKKVEILK